MKKLSLKGRILAVVVLSCAISAGVAVGCFLHFNQKAITEGMVQKQRTVHNQMAAATQFIANQGGLDGVVEKYSKKYTSADSITKEERLEILKQVPIYAAMQIGKENADVDRYTFRVFSNEPRKKENLANTKELEVFQKFENDPSLKELVQQEGGNVTVYRPVRLSKAQGCLTCHGDPATSPWKNGTDILGYKMENWTDGKLHGVFAISQNEDEVIAASLEGVTISPAQWLVGAIILGAIFGIGLAIYVIRGPIEALTRVAAALGNSSRQVHHAAQVVAPASERLSSASTEQAASLEETAASIEQMNSMVARNTENAKKSSETATASKTTAENGREVVQKMIRSMDEINSSNSAIMNQVNQSNQKISEIVQVIQEIGAKTKVINDIVFQTKLLSFNASVEAARAGEHGKGFAVVAEEVGNLAQMSGNAAKEISGLLDSSVKKVESIVEETKARVDTLIREGQEKVAQGTEVANQCGDVLSNIVTNISSVAHMASEISSASNEQAQGVKEITKAMNQLDSVTQQNTAASIEIAQTAAALSQESTLLQEAVTSLLRTVSGDEQKEQNLESVRVEVPENEFAGKVVAMRKVSPSVARKIEPVVMKKVSGEPSMPSQDHPGFEGV